MESKRIEAQVAQDDGEAAALKPETRAATVRPTSGDATPGYQVIVRHLAKFRDGARALLDAFGERAAASPAAPPVSERPVEPVPEPKGPLQVRIERHMGSVDRALLQTATLRAELAAN